MAAGAYHSLAVGSDGQLYTWGSNSHGQLARPTTGTFAASPQRVSLPAARAGAAVAAVAAGAFHSVVRLGFTLTAAKVAAPNN